MRGTTAHSKTLAQVIEVLERIAPPGLAQSWDNVGLLAGDRSAACRRILLAIDLTPAVLAEAAAKKCQLIVAYHPPLFRPISRILADGPETDALLHGLIAAGLAVYSPHTALDAAAGGTNDVLAGLCKLTDLQPFEYVSPAAGQFKVATFVPAEHLEAVAAAMFKAGAGRIGDYTCCSFRLAGEGTFFGTAGAQPRVGRRGRFERVAETRLELITSEQCLPEVIAALRLSHPYEEPALDIYPLAAEPAAGIGRVGRLPAGATLGGLAHALRRATRSRNVALVGPPGTRLRRAAVCAGAAGRLPLEKSRCRDCDVIVTGEIRHHDALAVLRHGKTAIALGHWESERPVLAPLCKRLAEALGAVTVLLSRRDRSPVSRWY